MPTKENGSGKQQPYNPKTGEYEGKKDIKKEYKPNKSVLERFNVTEDEIPWYDYKTEDIDWAIEGQYPKRSGIFDKNTLGGYGGHDEDLQNKDNIVEMSVNEYFEKCAEGFGNETYDQFDQIKADKGTINHLLNVIFVHNKRFPMPFIDFNNPSDQEGRHRMYVAGLILGFDTKFPVLAINNSKEAVNNKIRKMDKEIKRYYERNFPDYEPTMVNVGEIVKQNKLLEDNSVLNRRTENWGSSYKDYKINKFLLDNEFTQPIRIVERNGVYKIDDGMHRMIALQNEGYTNVEVLVKHEK